MGVGEGVEVGGSTIGVAVGVGVKVGVGVAPPGGGIMSSRTNDVFTGETMVNR
jgi:hypothetical protein